MEMLIGGLNFIQDSRTLIRVRVLIDAKVALNFSSSKHILINPAEKGTTPC
jgi:hypothetical protein